MRPAKGEAWEPRDRRAADALGHLCDVHAGTADDPTPTRGREAGPRRSKSPSTAPRWSPASPLPDEVVEQLRANATIEPVLVDEHGVPIAIGRRTAGLSPKKTRSVLLRDGSCRCGCGLRHGLEIHHLVPRSWGGTDDISNLAAVFPPHHRLLIPHGPYALVGNPNVPGGLRTVVYADLTARRSAPLRAPTPTPKTEGVTAARTAREPRHSPTPSASNRRPARPTRQCTSDIRGHARSTAP